MKNRNMPMMGLLDPFWRLVRKELILFLWTEAGRIRIVFLAFRELQNSKAEPVMTH